MKLDKFIEVSNQCNRKIEEDFLQASGSIFTENNQELLRRQYRIIAENAILQKRREIGGRALGIIGDTVCYIDMCSRQDSLLEYYIRYNGLYDEQKESLQEMLLPNGNLDKYEEGIRQLVKYKMHISVLREFIIC